MADDGSLDINADDILDDTWLDENDNAEADFADPVDKPVVDEVKTGSTKVVQDVESIENGDTQIKPRILNKSEDLIKINIQQNTPAQRLVEDPLENNALITTIKENEPSVTVLNQVMEEIAEEIAYLKSWRRDNYKADEDDTSDVSQKRVRALKELVSTIVEREKILKAKSTGKIDFYGEGFKKVFAYFLEKVQSTFEKVNIPEQFNDIFFSELAKQLNEFEKTAEKIYYGKKKS